MPRKMHFRFFFRRFSIHKKCELCVSARARKFHTVCGNSFVGFVCFLNFTVEKTKQTNYEGKTVEWEEHIIITIYTRKSILRGVRIQELFHYNYFRLALFSCSNVAKFCQNANECNANSLHVVSDGVTFAADEHTSHKAAAIKCMRRRIADEHEPCEERNNFSSQLRRRWTNIRIRLISFPSFFFARVFREGEVVVE